MERVETIPLGIGTAEPADYLALMKPRVMSLVVFTAWVGLICAPVNISILPMAVIILCIAVGAGASGALNMWYDADIDAAMTRTRKRPIPRGTINRETALTFGIMMSFFAVLTLWMVSNIVAAGLLAFTIFFYAVIYTMWLKRSTPQNIVIGGAAGAFPPMIGWAAVTGEITIDSTILFLIIFLWTPAHFWALALYKTGDYDKAGIPMMPNVKGPASTRLQILIYALLLAAICVAPIITGLAGMMYGGVALLLNLGFVGLAFKVWKSRAGERAEAHDEASLYAVKSGDLAARNLFAYSIIYLFAIFGVLAIENLLAGVL
ncbi:MAG: protoheme IX farnesyltransferase [Hellea sp.]|nr:protoheme IX farnesyltransferase [Hellea sp.]